MTICHSDHLRIILNDRATLYSGNRKVRADLVDRTLLAASYVELGLDMPVEDALFRLMHRVACS
ncbi:hypothetical protein ACO34A_28515 (plasmid) [Rhizobium sp. ACO-34A]|nr:hypothetical protein [Rhizobium sp. ACO-34A]ATN37712.1 hypothetical protein ACO34A_28515 [Rhizobium sp. ACO-34A]